MPQKRMPETRHPVAEKLYLGPFKGSDRPDKIAVFPDKSTQIIWKTPGSRVSFDEREILGDPVVSDIHRAVGYRLLQPDGSTVGLAYTDEAVVARRYSQEGKITSERVFSRKGINRDYNVPSAVVVGEQLSLLSGAYSGRLAVVNELTRPPYIDDASISGRDSALHLLHGGRGMFGHEYNDIPVSEIAGLHNVLNSLDRAEYKLSVAVGNVGIIAVQNHGVVLR
jgi:hypothetical protein